MSLGIASAAFMPFYSVFLADSPKLEEPNLYIFVGLNHSIAEQHALFNELLESGDDGQMLQGVDAIALETFWTCQGAQPFADRLAGTESSLNLGPKSCSGDLQGAIEYYLQTGDSRARKFLHTCLKVTPPLKLSGVDKLMLGALDIVRNSKTDPNPDQSYAFYGADMCFRVQEDLIRYLSVLQLAETREYNGMRCLSSQIEGKKDCAVEAPAEGADFDAFINLRVCRRENYDPLPLQKEKLRELLLQAKAEGRLLFGYDKVYGYLQGEIDRFRQTSKGKVVVSQWGREHVEKKGIVKYVPKKDQALSVIVNGGGYDTALLFDQVVRDLGWENEVFVWVLPPNTREADLVIHLPNSQGRTLTYINKPPEGFPSLGVLTYLREETAK